MEGNLAFSSHLVMAYDNLPGNNNRARHMPLWFLNISGFSETYLLQSKFVYGCGDDAGGGRGEGFELDRLLSFCNLWLTIPVISECRVCILGSWSRNCHFSNLSDNTITCFHGEWSCFVYTYLLTIIPFPQTDTPPPPVIVTLPQSKRSMMQSWR